MNDFKLSYYIGRHSQTPCPIQARGSVLQFKLKNGECTYIHSTRLTTRYPLNVNGVETTGLFFFNNSSTTDPINGDTRNEETKLQVLVLVNRYESWLL